MKCLAQSPAYRNLSNNGKHQESLWLHSCVLGLGGHLSPIRLGLRDASSAASLGWYCGS